MMFVDDSVSFRKACETDLNSIWDLLHADSKMVKEDEIKEQLHQIFVLEYQKRILGVLCGTYSGGQANILWVTIHPFFPEYPLREVMIEQFTVILCRAPGDGMKREPLFDRLSKWFRRQPVKPFLKIEGAVYGVQDQ